MNVIKTAAAALLLFALAACVAGTAASHEAVQGGSLPTILVGFWHGLIAPFTLIGAIIEGVAPELLPWSFRFYEVQNVSVLYDVGFFAGMVVGPSIVWTRLARRG